MDAGSAGGFRTGEVQSLLRGGVQEVSVAPSFILYLPFSNHSVGVKGEGLVSS